MLILTPRIWWNLSRYCWKCISLLFLDSWVFFGAVRIMQVTQGLNIIPFKLKHPRRLLMCTSVLLQSTGNLETWLWPWGKLSPPPRLCRFSTSGWGMSTSSTTMSKSSSTCWSASSDWSRRPASPLWDPSSSSHLRWKLRSPLVTRNRMMRSGSKIFIRGDAASPMLLPVALSLFSRKLCCHCLGKKNLEGT